MKRFLSVIAAALTLSTGAAYAQAPRAETRSTAVGYLDLDLTSAAGRATLQQRIENAVERVCGERPAPLEMVRVRGKIYRVCIAEAQKGARQQMAKLFGNQTIAENKIRVSSSGK